MTFKMFRLRGIERELARLNANLELIMVHSLGVTPHSKASKPSEAEDTSVEYTDEKKDFELELVEMLKGVKDVPPESN